MNDVLLDHYRVGPGKAMHKSINGTRVYQYSVMTSPNAALSEPLISHQPSAYSVEPDSSCKSHPHLANVLDTNQTRPQAGA